MRQGFICCLALMPVFMSFRVSLAALADFDGREYTETGTGLTLPYRLFTPIGYDPTREYPLTLFLHGAGESGTDNVSQVNQNIDNLVRYLKRPEYASFLLAPQTNSGWAWWGDEPSDATRMSLAVMEELQSEFSIDSNRLYVTGLSMGGYGTWEVIWQRPGQFAAAVPICGGGDTSKAALMVDQPIWAFHAANDGVVPVQRTREMIAAIRAAGGDPLYTEYSSGGHGSWIPAYRGMRLYEWMFSQGAPEPQPGDLDFDWFVGGADLDIVRSHWGQTVPRGSLLHGDPSGNGVCSGQDLEFVKAHWGERSTLPDPTVVPEPAALSLLLGATLPPCLFRWRRRPGNGNLLCSDRTRRAF